MNRVVHFEIHAKDMDMQQKFYATVFGWDFKDMGADYGGYRMVLTGPAMPSANPAKLGINDGMTPRVGEVPGREDAAPTNAFVCIIGVEDIDTILEKVRAEGGVIAVPKAEVPEVGLLAYCKDPEGNLFGVMQSTMRPE